MHVGGGDGERGRARGSFPTVPALLFQTLCKSGGFCSFVVVVFFFFLFLKTILRVHKRRTQKAVCFFFIVLKSGECKYGMYDVGIIRLVKPWTLLLMRFPAEAAVEFYSPALTFRTEFFSSVNFLY